jgi:hypothetical protein
MNCPNEDTTDARGTLVSVHNRRRNGSSASGLVFCAKSSHDAETFKWLKGTTAARLVTGVPRVGDLPRNNFIPVLTSGAFTSRSLAKAFLCKGSVSKGKGCAVSKVSFSMCRSDKQTVGRRRTIVIAEAKTT